MRDFQERDTRPDPKDELRNRLKAEDDRYKDANCILKAAGLQDEYWPKSMEEWKKLEKKREWLKVPLSKARVAELEKALAAISETTRKQSEQQQEDHDNFYAFKFALDNGLTVLGLQPLDYYESLGKLTQRMKDYQNGRNK